MAEPKTKETTASVSAFLKRIPAADRRADCQAVVDLMRAVTKEEPKMWGASIVGFGRYTLKYAGGREVEWPIAAFSPRKSDLTIYLMGGFVEESADLMKSLGKYKTGKCCLYIKKLSDVDPAVLKKLVTRSVKFVAPRRISKP
jgi:hypothetical protein